MGTNGNVFELFDVGLYEGAVAPAFQLPDYVPELLTCKRYCYFANPPARGLVATTTTLSRMGCNHPVTMRAAPTITIKNTAGITDGIGSSSISTIPNNFSTVDGIEFDATIGVALTAGRIGILYQQPTPSLFVSARM
jgi:hypothetical protein